MGITARSWLTLLAAIFGILFLVMLGISGIRQENKRPSYCESEASITAPTGGTRVVVDNKASAAADDQEKGRALQERQSVARRQRCEEGSTPSGLSFFQVFVPAMALVLATMVGLLTHWTAVEERPTKRARLIPTFPDADREIVRIINVGGSPGRLLGLGFTAGPIWYVGAGWSHLRPLSRLVATGDTEPVEYPFPAEDVEDEGLFTVLVRYSDAYGQAWEAWRTYRMGVGRKVSAVQDGEQRGRRR